MPIQKYEINDRIERLNLLIHDGQKYYMNELRKKLFIAGLLIFLIITIGTIGYIVIEDWIFLDALYMTVITLTTVGYREIHELSRGGKTNERTKKTLYYLRLWQNG